MAVKTTGGLQHFLFILNRKLLMVQRNKIINKNAREIFY